MTDIKLPIKYTLFPIKNNQISSNDKTIGYIISKCYVLEENVKYSIEGNIYSSYTIIQCKNINLAVKNNDISDKYLEYVKYIFTDYEEAKIKREELNSKIIESITKLEGEQVAASKKIKIEKIINSMQKMNNITEKKFEITASKKLILK